MTPDLMEAAKVDWQYSWEVATGYALVGEKEQALEWLAIAVRRGFSTIGSFSEHDSLLASLSEEGRFRALMAEARTRFENLDIF